MSFVKLSPPRGMIEVYHRLPRSKMATSVVPAPMSIRPDAELLLVVGQDGGARGDLVEDDLLDVDPGPLDAGPEVLDEGDGAGDDVDVDLELDAVHAQRIADPVLLVHDELLGDDVDDLPVGRDRDGLGLLDDPADVVAGDLPVLARDGDHPAAVEALDVGARDADEGRVDGHVRP